MSIKVLSRDVVNQISAGEVVEKPASIIKELVENSIDAGSTAITIEIEGGGIDRICVTDNGSGIKKDEVCLAFTPHATSKLEKIDDLYSLSTMGFRGEALATISAVSKVTLITKTKDDDVGIRVEMEGQEEISRSEIACVTGTKIDVKNVFFNTPARLKFLRKPKSEENDITNYVEKLMLSHSDISFKYIVDGKTIYNTSNASLLDNIYTIYGKEVANNVLEVNYEIAGYKVWGYVSKPEYSKANRTYQTLFVNSRFCNNPLVSTAVSNAYEDFAMKGKFPLYILFLSLPKDEVDVNVHPNKLEVKFVNTHKVYRVCSDAVFKALSDFNHIKEIEPEEEQPQEVIYDVSYASLNKNEGISYNKSEVSVPLTNKPSANVIINDESNGFDNEYGSINRDNGLGEKYAKYFTQKENGSYGFELTNNLLYEVNLSETSKELLGNKQEEKQNFDADVKVEEEKKCPNTNQNDFCNLFEENYSVVGKIFNTYLILEYQDKVYFIDQHAAHERQRYDALLEAIDTNTLDSQMLLIPYVFNVSSSEANFLLENLEVLNGFGIEIFEYGDNCFKISALPMILAEIDLGVFINQLLSNINGFAKSPREIIKEKFMQMACKSAVKGGDDLKDIEIKRLLDGFKDGGKVLLCPHGRPIVVEITEKQVEKWFKRIL